MYVSDEYYITTRKFNQRKFPIYGRINIHSNISIEIAFIFIYIVQTAHFIRCVMPNTNKSSIEWDDELVLNQVRYLGLVENTRVRRAGFPYRMKYERFEWRQVKKIKTKKKA